jgi:hypothetical protein
MSLFAGVFVYLFSLGFLLVLAKRTPRLAVILIGGLFLRLLLSIYGVYLGDLPGTLRDENLFHNTASLWSRHGFWGCFEYFTTGRQLYSWLTALSYAVLGADPFLMISLNAVASLATALILAHDVSRISGSRLSADFCAFLFCFFPTVVQYSVSLLREAFLILILTLSVSFFIRYVKMYSIPSLLMSFIFLMMGALLHTGFIFVMATLAGVVLIQWVWMGRRLSRLVLINMVAGTVLLAIGLYAFLGTGLGLDKAGGRVGNLVNLEVVQRKLRAGDATGRAGYLTDMVPRTWLDLVWQAPVRTVYFLFAPFPWMVRTPLDLIGFLISLMTFGMLGFYLLRVRTIWREPVCRALSIFLLIILMVFAMATRNYGTAIRHKSKFLSTALVLLAPAWTLSIRREEKIISEKRFHPEVNDAN